MLVEERQMKEFDSVLLRDPLSGVGYQTAAALNRLAKKVLGLIQEPEQEKSLEHLKILSVLRDSTAIQAFDSFVLSPPEALSRNRPLSTDEQNRLESDIAWALQKNPELLVVALLPSNTSHAAVSKVHAAANGRAVLLMCPATFGLRDRHLLDSAITSLSEHRSFRGKLSHAGEAKALVFLPDLVGFVVSLVISNRFDGLRGKTLQVPAMKHSPEEFSREFLAAFQAPKASNLLSQIKQRVLATLPLPQPEHPLETLEWENENLAPTSLPSAERIPALECFPTPMTSLSRALQQSAASYARSPEKELHYFPNRAI